MYFSSDKYKTANCKLGNRLLLLLIIVFSVLSSTAQNINKPNKMGPMGTQVNTKTGNLYIARNDIHVPARGFDLDISFGYNSYNFEQNSGFGNGWSFGYSIKYTNDTANSKTISWGDGREDNYKQLSGGVYQSPKGYFNTFTQYQPNKYLLTELNGTKFYFDNSTHKRITKMEEPNGNYINFNYTDTLLASLVNTAGQSISFTYNGLGNLATVVDAIAAPTRIYTYTYDGNNNLTQVTDPLGGTYKYSFLVNGPMKTMTDKNNNAIDIIYFNDFSISEIIGCNKRISFSYDTSTNITIVTDHLTTGDNQVTKYRYKKSGDQVWLSSISGNCCGFNNSFEFDDNGNKVKQTDAKGNIHEYAYDAFGNVVSVKDPLNQVTTYTYAQGYNKITSVKDAKGNLYNFAYDDRGNPTTLTEPGNQIYTATYNAAGDVISTSDPKGNNFTFSYNTYGRLTSINGPDGFQATLTNDERGNLLSYTDALGNTHSAEFDILNRLKKLTDPLNDFLSMNYDAQGNIISFVNKNTETLAVNYDASNRVVKIKDPGSNQTELTYDGMNNITALRGPLDVFINLSYDARNNFKEVTDALNNKKSFSYDENGNITSVVLPNGMIYNATYDKLNRMISTRDALGTIVTYEYDANNNITSYTNATGAVTTATYDNHNRMTSITDPLGVTQNFVYDKNNMVVSYTDRNGHISNLTYDGRSRIKTITDEIGSLRSIIYDAAGNISQIRDQNNNITSYTYDKLNRLLKTIYANGEYSELAYDKKDNIISRRLPDGTIITFQYDSLNRLTKKIFPDDQVFSFSYDALGRVISASNSTGTILLTYDVLNRITSETFDGRTTNYNYNISGRIQTTIYPDSTIITKSFDTRNRLISIAKNADIIASYQYNNNSQVISKTLGNGLTSTMQYDFANRLSSLSTGSIQNSLFSYDKDRNKTAINRSNNSSLSEHFVYDNAHRLINYKRGAAGSPSVNNSYSYDALGNRTSANLNGANTTYTSNNLNQLINSNNGSQDINFEYDSKGNLTFDGRYYKYYDAEGRLLKDSTAPLNVLTYQYDAFGRRVVKNINGTSFKYTYSGHSQIEERSGATNALLNRIIFKNFLAPVIYEKNNNSYYYHQNELNTVEAITNNNGKVVERYQYDVYGKPEIFDGSDNPLTSSAIGNRFAFTGQLYDSITGNYQFPYRDYSPATGTFNQRDLIGYADGMGLYQYVHNNPANGVDILGLADDPCKHDPNKIKYITQNEIARTKQFMKDYQNNTFPEYDYNSNLSAIGSADSRYYTGLDVEQFGHIHPPGSIQNEEYFFKGQKLYNYEVNYYFTGYASGYRGFGGSFSQATSRLWNGLKGGQEIWNGANGGWGRLGSAFNPVDTRTTLAHSGNLDARSEFGVDGISVARDVITLGAVFDMFNSVVDGVDQSVIHRDESSFGSRFDNKITEFGEWWPVINPKTGEMGYEFFSFRNIPKNRLQAYQEFIKNNCPQNNKPSGTQKPKPNGPGSGSGAGGTAGGANTKIILAIGPKDPNAIIGPDGVPTKRWVSVKDRLPYTILYENDTAASAPAKFVRVTTPIEPKQDAATFQLGSFGFNNQSFVVPPGTASYYQRLDCIDSLGLFVDITAGYDQINNQAFWEFQSIDPVTLLPPADPFKGFVLQQDSLHPNYGHGFVNFTIKPIQTAVTLDTIGARAAIVFDFNDTIPTNIANNTIDAFAPTSYMNPLPPAGNNTVDLSWGGMDDTGGCGLKYYTLYVSKDGVNFNIIRNGITRTDTSFTGAPNTTFYFFVLATDSVGNTETLRPGEVKSVYFGAGALPVTWLYFRGVSQGKDNLLEWATATEQNSKEFKVERSLNETAFTSIGTLAAAGNSTIITSYQFKDYNIDRLNSAVMFYRLKQFDKNGAYHYSNIVRLNYNQKENTKSIVYPNPTQGLITVTIGDKALIGTTAAVYDENGKLLEAIKITGNSQTFNMGKYVNGTYFIKLSNKEVLRVVRL